MELTANYIVYTFAAGNWIPDAAFRHEGDAVRFYGSFRRRVDIALTVRRDRGEVVLKSTMAALVGQYMNPAFIVTIKGE